MSTLGRTRSSISLRKTASPTSAVVGGLGASVLVEILKQDEVSYQVRPYGITGAVPGYVPLLGVALPKAEAAPFPLIVRHGGRLSSSVPGTLKAAECLAWLNTGGKPTWLPVGDWNRLEVNEQIALVKQIKQVFRDRATIWQTWLNEISATGRQAQATLAEWLTLQAGGANVWSVRPERIFAEPNSSSAPLGWVNVDDILLWSGHTAINPGDAYPYWYHVQLHKLGRALDGWFRADLIDPYSFPTAENDPTSVQNAQYVFDLSRPMLRFPADPEIAVTLAGGYSAAQYINIKAATGKSMMHFNLCGQFCVAALCGSDVIPMLKQWLPTYSAALRILNTNIGTSVYDLNTILKLFNRQGESYQYSPGISSTSPTRLGMTLERERMAISGVVINNRGRVDARGSIAHWVVLEDVLSVGSGGWVRVYNPYINREEVYPWDVYIESMAKFPYGLWVDKPQGIIND